uniref:JmjC domain-containing protein 5 n=1 Tax=Syphacia muris TaxID=451379 RepID=A0A0N5AL71_9BILA
MISEDDVIVEVFTPKESERLLKECLEVRNQVFVVEQGVDVTLEIDGADTNCIHIAARIPALFDGNDEELTVGTCRLQRIAPYVKLERLAVAKKWRHNSIGKILCQKALKKVEKMYPHDLLIIHAQLSVVKFYEDFGFCVVSDVFTEANIQHKTMVYIPRLDRIDNLNIWNNMCDSHTFIPGECWDVKVMENIRNLLKSFRNMLFFKDSCKPRILHYQHDLDVKVIGRSLIRAYQDYCIALQNPTPIERALKLEEFLMAFVWEKLNTGHYSLVSDAWRELYSALSAAKSLRLFENKLYLKALKVSDFGLMMGGDIDGQSLSRFAHHIHTLLPVTHVVRLYQSSFPIPKPLPNSQQVRKVHRPSMEQFLDIIAKQEPVIITGVVTEWPAFKKWNFDYFNSVAGNRTVPVELGNSYASDDWKQTFMTIREYIQGYIENEHPSEIGYFAQHRLFDQIPEFFNDLILPDYYSIYSKDDVDLMIWFGPAGTVSPLHTDPKSNIFCQVYGRKFFRMVPYSESEYVYRHDEGLLTNTTEMDVEKPDLKKYPKFSSAHVYDCVVEAGDSLYLPPRFWHHVRSLDPSISVSCWFEEKGMQ